MLTVNVHHRSPSLSLARRMTDPAFVAALEAVRASKSTKHTIDACEAFVRARDGPIHCEEANQLLRSIPFQMRRVEAVRALAPALVDFDRASDALGSGFRDWEGAELAEAVKSAREPTAAYGRRVVDATATTTDAPVAIEMAAQIDLAPDRRRELLKEMMSAETARTTSSASPDATSGAETLGGTLLYSINLGLLDEQSENFDVKTGPLGRLKFAPGGPTPPPELERRGLTKREWGDCVDALWSALERHPFHGNPKMECVACCCPFGPLTFITNHCNPFCWYLYCPYHSSRDGAVKKLNQDILASHDVVAKVNRNVVQFFDRSTK